MAMTSHALSNKEAAIDFLRMVVAKRIKEAYAKHVAPDFRHHNPYFGDSPAKLMAGMEEAHRANPDTTIDVKRAIAEGDLVAVHSHVTMKPGDPGVAVVHLFRFRAGKVVELWDVGQPVPSDAVNKSGMF